MKGKTQRLLGRSSDSLVETKHCSLTASSRPVSVSLLLETSRNCPRTHALYAPVLFDYLHSIQSAAPPPTPIPPAASLFHSSSSKATREEKCYPSRNQSRAPNINSIEADTIPKSQLSLRISAIQNLQKDEKIVVFGENLRTNKAVFFKECQTEIESIRHLFC